MTKSTLKLAASAIAVTMTMGLSGAYATDGYFLNGVGARNKALAGAGTASSTDATAISTNPAGLVHVGNELDVSLSLFRPDRGYTGSGPGGFTPAGNIEGNESENFFLPNLAYARKMGENGTFAFSVSGNGGMNTDYAAVSNPVCGTGPFPAPNGVFCGGETGVDLQQIFISAAYAQDHGSWSWGVAPIFAVQLFEAKGLAAFGGVSTNPAAMTDMGHDRSTGLGVRLGLEIEASEGLTLGGSWQSEISMSEFDDYAGLFADAGTFDIPQTFNFGVAADMSDNLTVMVDYRWINYEGVNAVGNSSSIPLPFGSANGPGFGWDDVNVVKVGVEWEQSDEWTFRGGYSNGNNPINSSDVTLNLLAPGTVTQHFTAGFEKEMPGGGAFEMAVMYAPEETVSGIEVTPSGPNPNRTIEIGLSEFELTAGWKFDFNQ
ncbi:MAG: OmpP1/FadL family transporter [bacterium]